MILNNSKYNQKWDKEKLLSLGDFSRGVSKHRPRNDEKLFKDGKYPFLQTGEIKEATLYVNDYSLKYNDFGLQQSKLWPKGTLCITIAANIAETAILGIDMCFPDSIVGFIPDKNKTTSEYMYYVFEYIKKQIQNRISGSIQDNINIDYLKGLEFRISPEQDKITNFLSNIDKKIINNEHIINTLESIAKTIYDYWFLQFEFPNEEGKPYKTSGGKMVWNEELKREIPEGWEVKPLKGLYNIERGISYTSEDITTGNGIPMINLACIDKNRDYRAEELKYYSGKIAEKNYVNAGDLLIACTDLTRERKIIGCPILVPDDGVKYTYSTDIAKISFSSEFNDMYIYMALRTDFYHNYIKLWASGTNVLHLNLKGLDWYKTYIPAIELQNKYANLIKAIHSQKSKFLLENQQLTSLRDFLLPLLMNGQVGFK